jgi:hypothetical protein
LPTNDHFSSNWTSRVLGGKGHEFVVELGGVLAGQQAVADDGVGTDPGEAAGLADAAALGDVLEDGHDLVLREAGVIQGGAFALGEAGLAGAAAEQATPVGAVAHGHGQVAVAALAVVGTVLVEATELAEVVHTRPPWRSGLARPSGLV